MTLRVIGAGSGRTGTTSLKLALERLLGGRCYHMQELFDRPAHFGAWTAAARGDAVDLGALLEGYVAAVDWPSAAFWPELAAAHPDAKILLSTRDPASWWKSASETIFSPPTEAFAKGPMGEMIGAILGARFTPDYRVREAAIEAYERSIAHVRATVPASRLVEWSVGDGWAPLAAMLGVPVPDEPFPRANTTEEFVARRAAGLGPPRQ